MKLSQTSNWGDEWQRALSIGYQEGWEPWPGWLGGRGWQAGALHGLGNKLLKQNNLAQHTCRAEVLKHYSINLVNPCAQYPVLMPFYLQEACGSKVKWFKQSPTATSVQQEDPAPAPTPTLPPNISSSNQACLYSELLSFIWGPTSHGWLWYIPQPPQCLRWSQESCRATALLAWHCPLPAGLKQHTGTPIYIVYV